MCPDLTLQPVLIDAERTDELNWLYQGPADSRPAPLDLEDLAVEVDWTKKRTLWMMFGSCALASIEAVLQRISDCSSLVVLESEAPDAYHLQAAERERLRELVGQYRLSIIVGGSLVQRADKLVQMVDIDHMDGWKPLLTQALMARRSQETRELFARLGAGVNSKVLHKNTRLAVSLPYLRNALINAPLASGGGQLARWKGSRPDRPVLVVSAGPSLNKQLPLLAQNQDLFTILAVDTVWPILDKHGIVPDAILAIDRISKPSWPRNALAHATAFCVDIGCAPRLVWSHDHNHVITSCHPKIHAMLAEAGARSELLQTGGSVATSAFQLAEELGGNPIVFIGQDLAHTDGKDHADGYIQTYSKHKLEELAGMGFDVDGYYGGRVRTERQLLLYKTWFESRIQALPERLIINATEGGARIAGAVQLPFATVCQEIRATSLRKAPLMEPSATTLDMVHLARLQEGVACLRQHVQEFRALASRGREICRKARKNPGKKQLARQDEVNRSIHDHERHSKHMVDIMGMARFDAVRYKTHIGQDMSDLADALKRYDEVYDHIETGADMALELLAQVARFYERLADTGRVDADLMLAMFPACA